MGGIPCCGCKRGIKEGIEKLLHGGEKDGGCAECFENTEYSVGVFRAYIPYIRSKMARCQADIYPYYLLFDDPAPVALLSKKSALSSATFTDCWTFFENVVQ